MLFLSFSKTGKKRLPTLLNLKASTAASSSTNLLYAFFTLEKCLFVRNQIKHVKNNHKRYFDKAKAQNIIIYHISFEDQTVWVGKC